MTDNGDASGSFTVPSAVGQFMLGLQVKTGPSKGKKKQTTSKGVVAATGVHFELNSPVYHYQGEWSIGFYEAAIAQNRKKAEIPNTQLMLRRITPKFIAELEHFFVESFSSASDRAACEPVF